MNAATRTEHTGFLYEFGDLLLAVIAAYLYFSFGNPRAITLLFQWLPYILLPLTLAPVTVPLLPLADTRVRPAERMSLRVTFCAVLGPRLTRVTV